MMQKRFALAALSVALLAATTAARASVLPLFSPTDNIRGEWVYLIDHSTKSVHIASYDVSQPDIVNALIRAASRRVEVIVIDDREQAGRAWDTLFLLASDGVRMVIKQKSGLM